MLNTVINRPSTTAVPAPGNFDARTVDCKLELLYLHNSHDKFKADGRMNSMGDLKAAIHEGADLRIRPKTMTVITTMIALVPIMVGTGTGSAVMKRMAAPMFGGLLTSFAMELLIYPVIFLVAKQFELSRKAA